MLINIVISLAAFFASLLSFFSGFGLGTILMPVIAIFLPLPLAIFLTAIVHMTHNFLKWFLLFRSTQWLLVFRFGIFAVIFAFLGALLLAKISFIKPVVHYTFWNISAEITYVKIAIGLLLIFFAFFEYYPIKNLHFKNPYIAGALSGFFGGFSGHQGAFRSFFLLQSKLTTKSFIATNAMIGFCVDAIRVPIYGISFYGMLKSIPISTMILTLFGAMLAVGVGTLFLTKITEKFIKNIVVILLNALGILLGVGWI